MNLYENLVRIIKSATASSPADGFQSTVARQRDFKRLVRTCYACDDQQQRRKARSELMRNFSLLGGTDSGDAGRIVVKVPPSEEVNLFQVKIQGKLCRSVIPLTGYGNSTVRIYPVVRGEDLYLRLERQEPDRRFICEVRWDGRLHFVVRATPKSTERFIRTARFVNIPPPPINPLPHARYPVSQVADLTGIGHSLAEQLRKTGYVFTDQAGYVDGEVLSIIIKANQELRFENYTINVARRYFGCSYRDFVLKCQETGIILLDNPGSLRMIARSDLLLLILQKRLKAYIEQKVGGFVRWEDAAVELGIPRGQLLYMKGETIWIDGIPLWVEIGQKRFFARNAIDAIAEKERRAVKLRRNEVSLYDLLKSRGPSLVYTLHRFRAFVLMRAYHLPHRVVEHPLSPLVTIIAVPRAISEELCSLITGQGEWRSDSILPAGQYTPRIAAEALGMDRRHFYRFIEKGDIAAQEVRLFGQRWHFVRGSRLIRFATSRQRKKNSGTAASSPAEELGAQAPSGGKFPTTDIQPRFPYTFTVDETIEKRFYDALADADPRIQVLITAADLDSMNTYIIRELLRKIGVTVPEITKCENACRMLTVGYGLDSDTERFYREALKFIAGNSPRTFDLVYKVLWRGIRFAAEDEQRVTSSLSALFVPRPLLKTEAGGEYVRVMPYGEYWDEYNVAIQIAARSIVHEAMHHILDIYNYWSGIVVPRFEAVGASAEAVCRKYDWEFVRATSDSPYLRALAEKEYDLERYLSEHWGIDQCVKDWIWQNTPELRKHYAGLKKEVLDSIRKHLGLKLKRK